jgi:hypothetical protein
MGEIGRNGKTDTMVTVVKSEQAILALYSVQQKSIASGNCYQLYQKSFESEDKKITSVNVPEKLVKYILNEESTIRNSNPELKSALMADSS